MSETIEKQLDEARKVLDHLMDEIDEAIKKLDNIIEALKNVDDSNVKKITMKIAYIRNAILMLFPYINDASSSIYSYLGI